MVELLQSWLTLQADTRPESVAVVLREQKLTYAKLEALSNQLARALKESGCRKGDRICLLMPKTPMAIVGILGIYKADCVYVPLDPSSPGARLTKIFLSSESRCLLGSILVVNKVEELLTDQNVRKSTVVGWLDTGFPLKKHITGQRIVDHEFSLTDILSCSDQSIEHENNGHDAAHILFTSGSTGTPKGVVITHANVIAFVDWATQYFGMNAADRVSGQTPLCFDLSIFDIFGSIAVGAELHLTPNDINLIPHKLADWIRDSRLTQWFSVPSILNYMAKFNVVNYYDFQFLKRILWCGEVLPTPSLVYWMKRMPSTRFTNLYGPTETTIASSYYTVPKCPENDQVEIPIGTACAGEELLVLGQDLQKVLVGTTGDLYIRGNGLSPGYWRDPVKTSAVFLKNPYSPDPADRIYKTGDLARIGDDGQVYFSGREDTQIKSRGYRIELGEIEGALNTINELQESAVVAIETDGFEGKSICCAYVPFKDNLTTSAQVREQLSKLLPPYMLPAQWMSYKALPKNANGKIDRRKLKETFQKQSTGTPPVFHQDKAM